MITDVNSIFEPTQPPLAPPAAEPPPNGGRKPRKKAAKKRGGRRAVVASPAVGGQAAPAVEPAKRPRKVRATSAISTRGGRKPRTPKSAKSVKLDLTTMMGALVGLKPDDANLVGKITQALQTVNKKSRARVLEAVGRIFA